MFHREGFKIILTATLIFLSGVALSYVYLPLAYWMVISFFLLVFYILILQFFRNPKRITVSNEADIIAPVDGKVVVIEQTPETEYLKEERIQISIFMSPLDVHVCRYPLSGTVCFTKYHPGKFLAAWHPKSSVLNERTTLVVEQKGVKVLFRQIAGALARRIVLYSKKEEKVNAGEEFGFIKFGSRVDIFLPLDSEIEVELNQKTKGGITRIAKLKK